MDGWASTAAGDQAAAPTMLQVRIRTVCVVGTDPPDSHDVDIDTVTDEFGIPFVPKNRMSARLRDAALTVRTSAGADPDTVEQAIELFGAAYSTADAGRMLRVGAAVWPRPAQASVAVAITDRGGRYDRGAVLLRQRLTRALTVQSAQNAIGPDGAPLPGALRHYRGIRPGIVLEAPLRWIRPPRPDHLRLLARCALALTQIGEGASDHLGRVTCCLDGDFTTTCTWAHGETLRKTS